MEAYLEELNKLPPEERTEALGRKLGALGFQIIPLAKAADYAAKATKVSKLAKAARGMKGAKVLDVSKQAKKWLGKDYRVIINKSGDKIFMSKDGLRKMRFDINNPHGYAPHIQLEILKNGEWVDAIPGKHHLYPKP